MTKNKVPGDNQEKNTQEHLLAHEVGAAEVAVGAVAAAVVEATLEDRGTALCPATIQHIITIRITINFTLIITTLTIITLTLRVIRV